MDLFLRKISRKATRLIRPVRKYGRYSYAQEAEDLVVARLLGELKSGFYVDVGSHHPHRFSNTYYFYQRGWSGLCVDPLPGTAARFKRWRPRDNAIEMGVSPSPGKLCYYMFDEPALNTFDVDIAREREERGHHIKERRSIETDTLATIIDRFTPRPVPQIDILSVDVEGLDLPVIQSNDWSRFRPRILIAECLGTDMLKLGDDPLARFVSDKGYSAYAKTGNSVIFVEED